MLWEKNWPIVVNLTDTIVCGVTEASNPPDISIATRCARLLGRRMLRVCFFSVLFLAGRNDGKVPRGISHRGRVYPGVRRSVHLSRRGKSRWLRWIIQGALIRSVDSPSEFPPSCLFLLSIDGFLRPPGHFLCPRSPLFLLTASLRLRSQFRLSDATALTASLFLAAPSMVGPSQSAIELPCIYSAGFCKKGVYTISAFFCFTSIKTRTATRLITLNVRSSKLGQTNEK